MESPEFGTLSVLVVDDNFHMRNLLKSVLRAFGCADIREASDGAKALEMLKDKRHVFEPDIMITDEKMVMLDGMELIRTLRTSPDSPNRFLPIIMCTGHGQQRKVCEARDYGVNEFLVKPITPKTLYCRMQSIVRAPRLFVECGSYFGPDRRRRDWESYCGPERRKQAQALAA